MSFSTQVAQSIVLPFTRAHRRLPALACVRYRGRTNISPGFVFGHEQTGEVVELGQGVHGLKLGDLVSVPFNVACGTCTNCKERKTNLCIADNVNPLKASSLRPLSGAVIPLLAAAVLCC